ncbi:hypothetical protein SCA6_006744 [Theobroma cacao]
MEKLVLCCAGVCLEEGFFNVADLDEALSILLPQTPEKLRELMRFSFVKPAGRWVPSYFLTDFIDVKFTFPITCPYMDMCLVQVMCTDYLEEKRELIRAILKDRKFSNLPKMTQRTLIIWGEKDLIFPMELGHGLKRLVEQSEINYVLYCDLSFLCKYKICMLNCVAKAY